MKKLYALLLLVLFTIPIADAGESYDAPDFILEDVDGNVVELDALLEEGPIFMSYWALWCTMCIKEFDALRPYYDEFDSLGINVLAVSVDKARNVPKVKPFAKSHKWEYIVVLDPENMMRDLYHVQAMPTSFIINQDKKIVFTHQGYKPGDEELIVEKIRELCKKGEEREAEK